MTRCDGAQARRLRRQYTIIDQLRPRPAFLLVSSAIRRGRSELGDSRLNRTAPPCPGFALLKRADERQQRRLLGVDRKRAADGLNEANSP